MPQIFLKANWENLIMANYPVNPSILLPYLPHGVELDLFNGNAYVSLVGFMFKKTKLFGIPMPLLGTFEEINLRFYVIRKEKNRVKRGVVFINETVPNAIVAWLANSMYKEHYVATATKNKIITTDLSKDISYFWKKNKVWNHLSVIANGSEIDMEPLSLEEYIFEHYYGYTKLKNNKAQEYRINHIKWKVHKVTKYDINCDFGAMYGSAFAFLNNSEPENVLLAKGSDISVNLKRTKF